MRILNFIRTGNTNHIVSAQKCIAAGLAMIVLLSLSACGTSEPGATVQQAYELRMQGKMDEAVQMLDKIIAADSKNSMAYFEMARAKFQIGLGKGQEILNIINDVRAYVDTALSLDPKNVTFLCLAGEVAFFQSYIAMQGGQENPKDIIAAVCDIYKNILEIKPDYKQPMLYLAEIYGAIPEEIGGDKAKAEEYAKQLDALDEIYGAKAHLFSLPNETDRIAYWTGVLEKHPDNAAVIEELGKDNLFAGNNEEGFKLLERALELDPSRNILLLDMARYHILTMMRGQAMDDAAANHFIESLNKYIDSESMISMKAFALGIMSKYYYSLDNAVESDRLNAEAEALDPYYSKAFGLPPALLFTPPGEISYEHRYHFRPF